MRPAAILVTAVALAAGCLIESSPPEGSAAIYWTFWSQSLGNIGAFTDAATPICTQAAVHDVGITLTTPAGDDLRASNGPCITANDVPGAAFNGLELGTWGYLLQGRRGGVTVFEKSGTFVVRDGERTIVDEAPGGSRARALDGRWDVAVAYTTGACAAGDRLKFELIDTGGATRVVAFSTDDAVINPLVDVPCEHTQPFTIPAVPPGSYELTDWVHVTSAGTPVAYSSCRPAWTQTASATRELTVVVTAADPAPLGNPGVCPP
jgi:hypothetical protein